MTQRCVQPLTHISITTMWKEYMKASLAPAVCCCSCCQRSAGLICHAHISEALCVQRRTSSCVELPKSPPPPPHSLVTHARTIPPTPSLSFAGTKRQNSNFCEYVLNGDTPTPKVTGEDYYCE